MSDMSCHYCGTTDAELRPYGPAGSKVCFPCAMATPERTTQTESAFGALFDSVNTISATVAIGTNVGPTSLAHALELAKEARNDEPV